MAEASKSGAGLVSGSMLERGGVMATQLRSRVMALPAARRRWIGASALLAAAICAGLFWYAGRPDWRMLFSGLDSKDVERIAQELSAAGIPYELTEDGSGVRVAADQVDKARMEVAAKGMPQSGRMGFELFDKPNWVGSEFDEKVNYQRALEGELEHTVGTLSAVRSARVHIVLPKDSLFAGGERAAKASVVLKLRGAAMPREQVDSIRNLVSGAVENLSPEQVTLIDADGRQNFGSLSADATGADAERGLEQKLVAMLDPVAGRDNVRASVTVSYEQASLEKTDEVYDPALVAPLTTHKSEQVSGSGARVAGVPGTASNTPGAAAPGSVQAAAGNKSAPAAAGAKETPAAAQPADAAAASKPGAVPPLMQTGTQTAPKDSGLPVYPQSGLDGGGQSGKEETDSYAVTRHLLHSEEGPGRIRRVTAAVLVNDRAGTEGTGKSEHEVWKPRSADEMKRLEQLARAAIGFDAGRGDQVEIENVGFSSNVPEPAAPAMERIADQAGELLHAEPGLLKTVGILGVGAMIVALVLRPMTRQIVVALGGASGLAGLPEGGSAASLPGGARNASAPGGSAAGRFVAGGRAGDPPGVYEQVSQHIRREPVQSTRLLETWISAPMEDMD